jgi:acyl-CoA reductase-like NAD-dependent aldehyde dehydrogenase
LIEVSNITDPNLDALKDFSCCLVRSALVSLKPCSYTHLTYEFPAASRTFVHASIAEVFIAGLKQRFKDQTPTLAPLADKIQFDRVMSYIDSGKKDAELIIGGDREGKQGCFIQPTIFLNPSKEAKIYKEEVFGPVLTIVTFETEEEVVELANDTSYGLSGTYSAISS